MPSLYLVSAFLHVVAATAWVGSMIFFAAVVVPMLRDPSLVASARPLLRVLGARYRMLAWASLAVLAVTGVTNLVTRGLGWDILSKADFWRAGFGRTLAYKLGFVALIFVSTSAHDLWMGKRAVQRMAAEPSSDAASSFRRRASWLGRATLVFSLVVVFPRLTSRGCS